VLLLVVELLVDGVVVVEGVVVVIADIDSLLIYSSGVDTNSEYFKNTSNFIGYYHNATRSV